MKESLNTLEADRKDSATMEPSFLVVLMEAEWNDFFPGTMRQEFMQLIPNITCIESHKIGPGEWEKLLREVNPDVLISGWSSPGLPKGFYGSEGMRLKYVCHLTGHISSKLHREDIAKGLIVTNWGNSISHTVAEHALFSALAALRRIVHFSLVMHGKGNTKDYIVRTLFGKRVGIHGFGQVARNLIPLLKLFHVQIKVHCHGIPDTVVKEYGVEPVDDLMELFWDSEIVFEVEGLNDKTLGSVTEEHLRAIPEGGVFVNCGRAEVVEEQGLIRVANEGRLNLALDVFHTEPLPLDSPLRGHSHVTLTPHIAGPMPEVRCICGQFVIENLRNWLEGEALSGNVSLSHFDNMT